MARQSASERGTALQVAEFNRTTPVGSKVRVWPGPRRDDIAGEEAVTTSEALIYGSGRAAYAVVFARRPGKAQTSFALTHVEKIDG